ncbi:UPF0014-domain-containing protein [Kickxella alabastrina]|uniref:UPF0014-domain-containing protein n=1 Tax=Kickxella alabastrina TaxID=61397 RepID=UPI00221FD90F|nr:UPF0014-domain-containing protein [Kickxella alabastrina]KAI7834842.1 UPF0014-domain-containing protein [Kickxella alabastrina]KAJ1947143.1 hypothetical protein GGF37_000664 [Kickxella alabastrina]
MYQNNNDNSGAPPLTWGNVALAASLLLINVGISSFMKLGLERPILVAGTRCFVQLTLLGLVLKRVFASNNPFIVLAISGVLGALAALEVSEWKSRRTVKGMFWISFCAICGSSLTVSLIGATFAMNFDPILSASKFIPTMGMVYGNTMVGAALGMESVLAWVDSRRDTVEVMLCFGASRWEAVRPIVVEAARTAMIPSITAVSITGLISIPGMMSGQILGGADVMDAARYQQVIMFMIAASVSMSVVTASMAVAFIVVDSHPMLRTERIRTKGIVGNSNKGKPLSRSNTLEEPRSHGSFVRTKAWKATIVTGNQRF